MPKKWKTWIDRGNRESHTFLSIGAGVVSAIIVVNVSAFDAYRYLMPLTFFSVFGIIFYFLVVRAKA
jgi:hypothetical protein